MNKVLVVLNAAAAKTNALDFACFITKLSSSTLSVLVVETDQVDTSQQADSRNTVLFENFCQSNEVNTSVQRLSNPSLEDIILETRFADMLIADPEMSLGDSHEGSPTRFIKELLAKSECPVILAPLSFDGIDEILFAYDGGKSAVFAIRQFTNLFPELTDKKIIVLQVNEPPSGEAVTEREKIQKLLQLHYTSIGFTILHGNSSDELFKYLLGRRNIFVVLGALELIITCLMIPFLPNSLAR